ncbi:MAG: metallophosphoesterase [Lachnospiraceae bacterium]|nr:metallophosphoesterase [Lachnospiraceae bacterium]
MIFKWDPETVFEINRYELKNQKIKQRLKIAFLADLHNCVYGQNNDVLFDAVCDEEPDIIAVAGDLIEAGTKASETAGMVLLYRLSKRFPIYYGVGNHEKRLFLYDCYKKQRNELVYGLLKCGVKLIGNKSYDLSDNNVVIKGLDIPHEYYRRVFHRYTNAAELEGWLGKNDPTRYNLLLAHDPSHFEAYCDYGPDLVFSGHVHGGIIRLPKIGGLVSPEYRLFPRYDAGFYEKGMTKMLVSRGLGSHTIYLRINNRPELITVTLLPEKE